MKKRLRKTVTGRDVMKHRKSFGIFLGLCGMLLLAGCQMQKTENTGTVSLEYTVMDPEEVPRELQEIIRENQEGEIKLTYRDQGYLYLVRGYGVQKSGGYSIAVNEVSLQENGIIVNTSLIGPSPDQEISKDPSYPCLVLKMEDREEEIIFE